MNNNSEIDNCKAYKTSENMKRIKLSWTIFLRQMYVITGVWIIYFSLGLSFGAPTVFIAQLRKEANSTDAVSPEMESWLSSIHGYTALPFVIITPIFAQKFGRKVPFILVCLNTALANILLYCSTTIVHILISEIMYGFLLGSNMTFLIPICTEYSSPHYRGMFLTIEASSFYWGVWVANAVGTFYHWKNIGIIGLVCCVYSLSSIFWPESPSWLAMKGRYEEAAAAHHWLNGNDEVSEEELANLIKSQKEYHEVRNTTTLKTLKDTLRLIKHIITTKGYYYPMLMNLFIISLYHFSGKLICTMYAVQIIHKITNSDDTAYTGMLILEGITIFGMSFGCFISKYLKRKTLLLSTASITIVTLFVISIYLYLVSIGVCAERKIVSLLLLTIFSVAVSCGPIIMITPLFGELILLQYRCSSTLILTLYSEILMATLLKLAPSIFRVLALHGAFLLYGICSSMFSVILFIYLPETKGKSIQEIENFFTTNKSEVNK